MSAKIELQTMLNELGARCVPARHGNKWFMPNGRDILLAPKNDVRDTAHDWANCLSKLRRMINRPRSLAKAATSTLKPHRKTAKKNRNPLGILSTTIPISPTPDRFRDHVVAAVGMESSPRWSELKQTHSVRSYQPYVTESPLEPAVVIGASARLHELAAELDGDKPLAQPAESSDDVMNRSPRKKRQSPCFSFSAEEIDLANRIRVQNGEAAYRQFINALSEEKRQGDPALPATPVVAPTTHLTKRSPMPTSNGKAQLPTHALAQIDANLEAYKKQDAMYAQQIEQAHQTISMNEQARAELREIIEATQIYRDSVSKSAPTLMRMGVTPVASTLGVGQVKTRRSPTNRRMAPREEVESRRAQILQILTSSSRPLFLREVHDVLSPSFPQFNLQALRMDLIALQNKGAVRQFVAPNDNKVLYQATGSVQQATA